MKNLSFKLFVSLIVIVSTVRSSAYAAGSCTGTSGGTGGVLPTLKQVSDRAKASTNSVADAAAAVDDINDIADAALQSAMSLDDSWQAFVAVLPSTSAYTDLKNAALLSYNHAIANSNLAGTMVNDLNTALIAAYDWSKGAEGLSVLAQQESLLILSGGLTSHLSYYVAVINSSTVHANNAAIAAAAITAAVNKANAALAATVTSMNLAKQVLASAQTALRQNTPAARSAAVAFAQSQALDSLDANLTVAENGVAQLTIMADATKTIGDCTPKDLIPQPEPPTDPVQPVTDIGSSGYDGFKGPPPAEPPDRDAYVNVPPIECPGGGYGCGYVAPPPPPSVPDDGDTFVDEEETTCDTGDTY